MGNADDDAEQTADWQSRQTPPSDPYRPTQPGQPPSPPWQAAPPQPPHTGPPQQPFANPPSSPHDPRSPQYPPSAGWSPPTAGPAPGSGYGPGYGHGYGTAGIPTPGPAKKVPWLVISVVVAVVVIVLGGAVFYVLRGRSDARGTDSTTAAQAPPANESPSGPGSSSASTTATAPSGSPTSSAPTVSAGSLASLLASPTDLAKFADGSDMTPGPLASAPFTGFFVDPSNCTGAMAPGDSAVYNGSGFTAFAGQTAIDASEQHKVLQVVAAFPSAADAKSFYDTQVGQWRGCKTTTMTLSGGGSSSSVKSGYVGETDGTATLLLFSTGATGRDCERGLTARKNVVVDVRVCSPKVGSGGYTLARDIGEKITGKR